MKKSFLASLLCGILILSCIGVPAVLAEETVTPFFEETFEGTVSVGKTNSNVWYNLTDMSGNQKFEVVDVTKNDGTTSKALKIAYGGVKPFTFYGRPDRIDNNGGTYSLPTGIYELSFEFKMDSAPAAWGGNKFLDGTLGTLLARQNTDLYPKTTTNPSFATNVADGNWHKVTLTIDDDNDKLIGVAYDNSAKVVTDYTIKAAPANTSDMFYFQFAGFNSDDTGNKNLTWYIDNFKAAPVVNQQLVSSSVENGDIRVARDENIILKFKYDIADASKIKLYKGETATGEPVATATASGNICIINPAEDLEQGTKYTIDIPGDVKSSAGYEIDKATTITFTTGNDEVTRYVLDFEDFTAGDDTGDILGKLKEKGYSPKYNRTITGITTEHTTKDDVEAYKDTFVANTGMIDYANEGLFIIGENGNKKLQVKRNNLTLSGKSLFYEYFDIGLNKTLSGGKVKISFDYDFVNGPLPATANNTIFKVGDVSVIATKNTGSHLVVLDDWSNSFGALTSSKSHSIETEIDFDSKTATVTNGSTTFTKTFTSMSDISKFTLGNFWAIDKAGEYTIDNIVIEHCPNAEVTITLPEDDEDVNSDIELVFTAPFSKATLETISLNKDGEKIGSAEFVNAYKAVIKAPQGGFELYEDYTISVPALTSIDSGYTVEAEDYTFKVGTSVDKFVIHEKFDAVKTDNTAIATVTLKAKEANASAWFAIAIYAADDSLLAVSYSDQAFATAGEVRKIVTSYTKPQNGKDAAYAKLFIWRNVGTLVPLDSADSKNF